MPQMVQGGEGDIADARQLGRFGQAGDGQRLRVDVFDVAHLLDGVQHPLTVAEVVRRVGSPLRMRETRDFDTPQRSATSFIVTFISVNRLSRLARAPVQPRGAGRCFTYARFFLSRTRPAADTPSSAAALSGSAEPVPGEPEVSSPRLTLSSGAGVCGAEETGGFYLRLVGGKIHHRVDGQHLAVRVEGQHLIAVVRAVLKARDRQTGGLGIHIPVRHIEVAVRAVPAVEHIHPVGRRAGEGGRP